MKKPNIGPNTKALINVPSRIFKGTEKIKVITKEKRISKISIDCLICPIEKVLLFDSNKDRCSIGIAIKSIVNIVPIKKLIQN